MDILTNLSPYWCADPTTGPANLTALGQAIWETPTPDAALIMTLPCCQIPVISPAGAAPDRRRTGVLWQLPFPYLPADIWMRRPREHAASYQMRLLVAMDALGLISVDERGPWYANPPYAPDSEARAASYRLAFDGARPDPDFDRACEEVQSRASKVWPDGYPADNEIAFSRTLALVALRGSAVLTAQLALAVAGEPGGGEQAKEILSEAHRVYGNMFSPSLDRPAVEQWYRDNKNVALDMIDQMVGAGIEPQESADAFRQVLA